MPVAGLLLERPGAVLASAAQVDDGAHALRGEARDLMRRGLRRTPQPLRDLMPVQIGQAEDAVVHKEHVGPRPDAARRSSDRLVPAGDAGHAPRVADLRPQKSVEHAGSGSEADTLAA